MVAHDLAGGEDLRERRAARAKALQHLVGHKGIVGQYLVRIGAQAVQHHAADHPRAQDADADAVVAGQRVGIGARGLPPLPLIAANRLVEALAGKNDLRHRVFRDGHGVGRPGGEHADPAGEERPGKVLHRARAIEHRPQIWKIFRDLRLGERGHPPSREDHLRTLKIRAPRRKVRPADVAGELRNELRDLCARLRRIDAGQRVGIAHPNRILAHAFAPFSLLCVYGIIIADGKG